MKTIVLTGGGTAGHVIPHLALLPCLEKEFGQIYYVGSHNGIEKKIVAEQARGVKYRSVSTVKLRRSFDLKNLLIPFKLVKGVGEAKKILKEIKPDIIFSKGGFVAYPVVRAAAKLKIPVVAHESDMSMGLANRLCAKHCKLICTTFKKTADKPNMIHTGSPIRESVFNGIAIKVERRHGFSIIGQQTSKTNDKGNLLVIGGSLGAAKINEAIRGGLGELLKNFNIVHICGKGKTAAVDEDKQAVDKNGKNIERGKYVQLEFVNDIEHYFAWADVVVSRAGSNSLCELLALKKPTLFIPLSKAQSRGDQIENAQEVIRTGAAAVLFEEDLTVKSLIENVNKVFKDKAKYAKNAANMGELNGTKRIADIIIKTKA